jgi:hypothetical protein
MKHFKFLSLLTVYVLAALFFGAAFDSYAQTSEPGGTPQEFTSLISSGFSAFFVSLAALVPLVVFCAAWLNAKFKAVGFWKQLVAWGVSMALTFIGWALHIGFMDGLLWYHAVIYGFALGLAANGFFDIKLIQALLDSFTFLKPKEPVKKR